MKKFAKMLAAACLLTMVFAASGCVYYPARPYPPAPYYGAVWVPAHWEGSLWIRGHWH